MTTGTTTTTTSVSSVSRADIDLTFNVILIDVNLSWPAHREYYSFPRLVRYCNQHQYFADTNASFVTCSCSGQEAIWVAAR